ncbi:hypothetical protein SRB17_49000 [Streptomyces sp. RB17]|uniref:hypothetical protein n=1 Tax=Streptomyces sp. RB17 TaxID=2585197 RepID=UPI00130C274D|nr:hypothetical protein [Streptomyces sp. RB17]MQY36898.1 hypothetical protein [Streptomyces sp. RB17]
MTKEHADSRGVPPDRRRKHTAELLAACAACLIPWTVMLGLTLPSSRNVHEWRLTWVGFDVLLIVALASTAFLAWRRSRSVILYAHATAVLLICDTWFDISLDAGTDDVWTAGGLALVTELPLAAFLIHRAHSLIALLPWPPAHTAAGDTAGSRTEPVPDGESVHPRLRTRG